MDDEYEKRIAREKGISKKKESERRFWREGFHDACEKQTEAH